MIMEYVNLLHVDNFKLQKVISKSWKNIAKSNPRVWVSQAEGINVNTLARLMSSDDYTRASRKINSLGISCLVVRNLSRKKNS